MCSSDLASRWAAFSTVLPIVDKGVHVVTTAGEPGQTCLALVDGKQDAQHALAKRCTYGVVWAHSATLNREGNALAVAVQPMVAWRELWVFRKTTEGWTVAVLPPATTNPELGYAEFAGWTPGGKQILVAREARGEGKYKRNFEVMQLDTLLPERQASDPSLLGAFQRWQDPAWKRDSVSVR